MTAKELALLFHETYEKLAPQFGYQTRPETKEFSESSSNGKLMIAVCDKVLNELFKQNEMNTQQKGHLKYIAINIRQAISFIATLQYDVLVLCRLKDIGYATITQMDYDFENVKKILLNSEKSIRNEIIEEDLGSTKIDEFKKWAENERDLYLKSPTDSIYSTLEKIAVEAIWRKILLKINSYI